MRLDNNSHRNRSHDILGSNYKVRKWSSRNSAPAKWPRPRVDKATIPSRPSIYQRDALAEVSRDPHSMNLQRWFISLPITVTSLRPYQDFNGTLFGIDLAWRELPKGRIGLSLFFSSFLEKLQRIRTRSPLPHITVVRLPSTR